MKAIILFLVLAAACSSTSEEDLDFNQENLLGTWTLTETLVDPLLLLRDYRNAKSGPIESGRMLQ